MPRGCGCSGFDQITRFKADGTTETSVDGGKTWQGNKGDPRFLPIPFMPRPEPPGEARRCNSAYSVRKLLEEATNQLISEADAWLTIDGLVQIIIGIIATIFPGIGTFAALIISGIIAAIFFVGKSAFTAAMTVEVFDEFQCIVYCHMDEEGLISEAGWIAIKLDVYQDIPGIAGNWIWGWVSALGPSGLNASTGMFTGVEADCSLCECAEACDIENWDVLTDPLGTSGQLIERDTDAGSITFASLNPASNGVYYITIEANDPDNACCFWVDSIPTGGFIHTYAHWPCGTPVDYGNLIIAPVPINICVAAVQMLSDTPFEITVFFGNCP